MLDKIKDFYDEWDVPIITLLVIVALFACVIVSVVTINKNSCNTYADMGMETQFYFWGGCFIRHPEFGWLPSAQYFNTINLYSPK